MSVFISGSRSITTVRNVSDMLLSIIDNGEDVVVGDANGVDVAVQRFFANANYRRVVVYSASVKPRNNIGKNSYALIVPQRSGEVNYIDKDRAMALCCSRGIVVWDGESKGSHRNAIELLLLNKPITISVAGAIVKMRSIDELSAIVNHLPTNVQNQHLKLIKKVQVCK